jgi:hypothetical protein
MVESLLSSSVRKNPGSTSPRSQTWEPGIPLSVRTGGLRHHVSEGIAVSAVQEERRE